VQVESNRKSLLFKDCRNAACLRACCKDSVSREEYKRVSIKISRFRVTRHIQGKLCFCSRYLKRFSFFIAAIPSGSKNKQAYFVLRSTCAIFAQYKKTIFGKQNYTATILRELC